MTVNRGSNYPALDNSEYILGDGYSATFIVTTTTTTVKPFVPDSNLT
jgi:hypothetical protein